MARENHTTTLIVTFLMLAGLLSAIPSASAEGDDSISWGIEYEWVNLNDDIQELTGLPYDDVITDIEESATYAGFNLEIVNAYSGISSIYVEQWDDSSVLQISDDSGTSHSVTTRVTEITLRHGMLYDAAILMDWNDSMVMSNPSIEVVLSADYETIAVMDILYTEYVTTDLLLVGSDLTASGNFGVGAGMGLFVDVAGNGETFDMDLDLSYDLAWRANSITSEWRLEHPSNIINMMDNGNDFDWECSLAQCGSITGSYSTQSSYSVSFTGLPLDEFGLEADALDLQISDSIPDSGTFDSDSDDGLEFEIPYDFGNQQTVTIDDGGTTTEVTEVMMDPYPPGMSLMVGYSFAQAAMGSGDQTTILDAMESAFSEWANDAGETIEFGTFVCDNGQEIPSDYVNDGDVDCTDGSDEGVDESEAVSALESKFMSIFGAFEESNYLKNMETFADRVEYKLEQYEDFEVEAVYVDGDYAALWSSEHSRYVGMQLIGITEGGNEYSVLGPETDSYNNNPPAEIHLVYLVGAAADEAEDAAEAADTIEELAPVSLHDVSAVIAALGEHAPDEMAEGSESGDGSSESYSSAVILIAVAGGILVLIIGVIVTLVLVMSRRRQPTDSYGISGGGYVAPAEPMVNQQFDSLPEETVALPVGGQSTMPSSLPPQQTPPAEIQGTMQQDNEVLEWPSGTGKWWYRDQNTGTWIVWQ